MKGKENQTGQTWVGLLKSKCISRYAWKLKKLKYYQTSRAYLSKAKSIKATKIRLIKSCWVWQQNHMKIYQTKSDYKYNAIKFTLQ